MGILKKKGMGARVGPGGRTGEVSVGGGVEGTTVAGAGVVGGVEVGSADEGAGLVGGATEGIEDGAGLGGGVAEGTEDDGAGPGPSVIPSIVMGIRPVKKFLVPLLRNTLSSGNTPPLPDKIALLESDSDSPGAAT